jgi:hypothetical protein
MINGIVALHSTPMRKDAAKKNGMLLHSVGCVGSHIRSSLFTWSFKKIVGGAPALLLHSNRSLLMLLQWCFFAFSSLWTWALMDTGGNKRSVSFIMEIKTPLLHLIVGPPAWTQWSLTRTRNHFEFGFWHVSQTASKSCRSGLSVTGDTTKFLILTLCRGYALFPQD